MVYAMNAKNQSHFWMEMFTHSAFSYNPSKLNLLYYEIPTQGIANILERLCNLNGLGEKIYLADKKYSCIPCCILYNVYIKYDYNGIRMLSICTSIKNYNAQGKILTFMVEAYLLYHTIRIITLVSPYSNQNNIIQNGFFYHRYYVLFAMFHDVIYTSTRSIL